MDKIDANENTDKNKKIAGGAIPKTKIKYQNNNLQENSSNVPHLNNSSQCHNNKMNGCSLNLENSLLQNEDSNAPQPQTNGRHYNQNIILQNNFHMKDLNGELNARPGSKINENNETNQSASKSPGSSDSESFDNLSLNSENGLIEEIILLPNNAFSEDEISINSDDCVYAYRGADLQIEEINVNAANNDEQDDETDFLEMDFDPEPNSEVENEIENLGDGELPAVMHVDNNGDFFYEPSKTIDTSIQNNWKKIDKDNKSNEEENSIITNKILVDSKHRQEQAKLASACTSTAPIAVSADCIPQQPAKNKNTGAKPKIPSLITSAAKSTSSKSDSKPSSLATACPNQVIIPSNSIHQYEAYAFDDDHCLECTENEFLSQNKQNYVINVNKKQCTTCGKKLPSGSTKRPNEQTTAGGSTHFLSHSRVVPPTNLERMSFSYSEDNLMERGRKSNESEDDKKLFNLCASKTFSSFSVELNDVVLDKKKKKMQSSVTIYSVNCDERTIVEALELIGIKANVDIIRQYFEEIDTKNSSVMSIPEYILHVSKRYCNYKKIIDVIKAACPLENIDLLFCPLEIFTITPDIVQVHSTEIASRWSPDTNLREILTFKNKHFHRLNVLGKIVNIIRQPANGQQTDILLNIPQYYKSGYVNIIKKL